MPNLTPTKTMPGCWAGQHAFGQHEEAGPLGKILWGVHHRVEAFTEGVGPAVSDTLGDMLEGGYVGLEDDRERG